MQIAGKVASALKSVFLKQADPINKKVKAVKRVRHITPQTLALTFSLAALKKPNCSHADVAAMAATSGLEISPQAIEQRYGEALRDFSNCSSRT